MSTTNPKITTEWEDIHVRLGNMEAPPKEKKNEEIYQELVDKAESINLLSFKNKKELDALKDNAQDCKHENLVDELHEIQQKRLNILKNSMKLNRFGNVIHVSKDQFIDQVTNASKDYVEFDHYDDSLLGKKKKKQKGTYVILHLYYDCVEICTKFNEIIGILADKFKYIKFTKSVASDVIPNYPIDRTPTILIYFGGFCIHQIIGTEIWGGQNISVSSVESVLSGKFNVINCLSYNNEEPRIKNKMTSYISNDTEFINDNQDDNESDEDSKILNDRGYSSLTIDSRFHRRI